MNGTITDELGICEGCGQNIEGHGHLTDDDVKLCHACWAEVLIKGQSAALAAQAQELAEAREVLQRLVDASTYEGLPNYQSVLLEAKVYLSRAEAKETIIDHRATPKYRTDGEVTG